MILKIEKLNCLMMLALQTRPSTPPRSHPEALAVKPDAPLPNTSDVVAPLKSMPKRAISKQENMHANLLPVNKERINSSESMTWASLPPNLLKSGKVLLFPPPHAGFHYGFEQF